MKALDFLNEEVATLPRAIRAVDFLEAGAGSARSFLEQDEEPAAEPFNYQPETPEPEAAPQPVPGAFERLASAPTLTRLPTMGEVKLSSITDPLVKISDKLGIDAQTLADATDTFKGMVAAENARAKGGDAQAAFLQAAGQPQREPNQVEKVLAGAQKGTVEALDFFTSPLGVATLGTGALPGVAQKVIAGAFVAQMAKSMPDQFQQFLEAKYAGDVEGMAKGLTSMGLTGTFIYQGAKHVATPGRVLKAKALAEAINRSEFTPRQDSRMALVQPTSGANILSPIGAVINEREMAPPESFARQKTTPSLSIREQLESVRAPQMTPDEFQKVVNEQDPDAVANRKQVEADAATRSMQIVKEASNNDLLDAMGTDNRDRINMGDRPYPTFGNGAQDYAAQEWLRRNPPKLGGEVVEAAAVPSEDTPHMKQLVAEADAIRASLPEVKPGFTRLWRGNRPDEIGKATSFTTSLEGIALPFSRSYKGGISYIDVPTADLGKYESKAGSVPGEEFNVPESIALKASPIIQQKAAHTGLDPAKLEAKAQKDANFINRAAQVEKGDHQWLTDEQAKQVAVDEKALAPKKYTEEINKENPPKEMPPTPPAAPVPEPVAKPSETAPEPQFKIGDKLIHEGKTKKVTKVSFNPDYVVLNGRMVPVKETSPVSEPVKPSEVAGQPQPTPAKPAVAKVQEQVQPEIRPGMSINEQQQILGGPIRDRILAAPSFPKLLAAAKAAVKSIHGKVREDFEAVSRQEPWDLLSEHAGIMNAKSARAKTLRSLADAVIKEANLPMREGGRYRGDDYQIDWDKVAAQRKPTPTPPPAAAGEVGPGMIGMGGALQGEVNTGYGRDIYGIAQRVREERAKAGQVAEVPTGEGISAPDSVEHGRELLAQGASPEKVLASFESTKRLSSDDMAVVRAHGEELAKAARSIEQKFGTESNEFLAAHEALSNWDKRTKPMQTEWHRMGQAQQGETDIDTGSFTGINRAYREATGRDLTGSQKQTAKKIAADVNKSDKAVEPAKVKLDTALDNLDEQGRPRYSEYVLKLAEKIVAKLDSRADASRKALAAMSVRFNVGLDPTVVGHLANIGASHIGHYGLDFVKWSDAMMRDVGPKVKPFLKEIYDKALKLVDAEGGTGPQAEKVKKVIKRVSAPKATTDLTNQRKAFDDYKSGQPMTPAQVKTLWTRAKTEYIDKGNDDKMDIVHKLATDFGLPAKDVLRGLSQNRNVKRVADEVWQKQRQARILKQAAKRWIEKADETFLSKAVPVSARVMFAAKTALHGTVAIGTHAPLEAFVHPVITANNFGKMYRLVASPEYYQMQIYEMARRPNYTVAQRNGLVNDMAKMEDFNDPALAQGFPKLAEWFREHLANIPVAGKQLSKLQGMGTRGYSVLKILRQDLFDNEWNKLAESERTDEMAKAIADSVNHMTGVVKKGIHPAANIALFAPKLLLSRLSVVAGDPVRAANSLVRARDMTPAEKWFVNNQFKEKAKIFSVFTGLLLANQQLNNFFGDKKKINGIPETLGGGGWNPMQSDFMKFRVAGMNFAWGSQFLTMSRLPLRLIQIGRQSGTGKMKYILYPDESMATAVWSYLRTQLSPLAGTVTTAVTKADYQDRPLPKIPGYGATLPVPKRLRAQGIKPYTWGEIASETFLPIPFAEGAKEIFHYSMKADKKQEEGLLKAFIVVLMMAATGGRLTEDWNPERVNMYPNQ